MVAAPSLTQPIRVTAATTLQSSSRYEKSGLALKGDLDAARSAVAQSMKLRPEINSVASWRAENLFYTNPRFTTLAEKTLYAGLRRAGFLDE